jgi:hypothetical protein
MNYTPLLGCVTRSAVTTTPEGEPRGRLNLTSADRMLTSRQRIVNKNNNGLITDRSGGDTRQSRGTL